MKRAFAACLLSALLVLTLEPTRGDDKADVKPINLDKLNTEKNEDDAHLSANGLALFYTQTAKNKSDIMLSIRKTSKAAFTAGKPMPEFAGKADFRSVFLTVDGR